MSFSFIGPWLLALWARAEEAGRGGTVNEHLERVIPTLGHVAQPHRQSVCVVLRVFAWSDTGTPQCVGMCYG